jgi:hypothetical protein
MAQSASRISSTAFSQIVDLSPARFWLAQLSPKHNSETDHFENALEDYRTDNRGAFSRGEAQ